MIRIPTHASRLLAFLSVVVPAATLILGTTGCSAPPVTRQQSVNSAFPDDLSIHTTLRGGIRSLDRDAYDGRALYGLEFDGYREDSWVGYELGATAGAEDRSAGTTTEDADFFEGYLGLRKTWYSEGNGYYPFVSVGATYVKTNRERSTPMGSTSPVDWGGGAYVRAGAYRVLTRAAFDGGTDVTAGADIRVVIAQDIAWAELGLSLGFGR